MAMKEKGVFIERGTLRDPKRTDYSCRAHLSCGPIEAIECTECHRTFMVIYISRVPEESGEHHHVAIQLDKEDISVCPYCGKK